MKRRLPLFHSGPVRHRLCSTLTLLAYVVTTIGLPVETAIGNPRPGCQCADNQKASGTCSCQKAVAGLSRHDHARCCGRAPGRSCCASDAHNSYNAAGASSTCSSSSGQPPSASCCSTRRMRTYPPSDTPAHTLRHGLQIADAETPHYPSVSACGCGENSIPGLIHNADPRLLSDRAEIPHSDDWRLKWQSSSPVLPDRSITPETPPPRVPAA